MSDPVPAADVAAARAYDALLVPALFGQWVGRVVDAAQIGEGEAVLDVACGTGVLAREARRRTGEAGYVAGVDPGGGMLAVARESCPDVDWRQGVAEALPFADASFDVVVSQFGLMFMDADRAAREMLRVLRPAGRLAVAVWDDAGSMPAYAKEIALLERVAGRRAADALRVVFALGDRTRLVRLFEDAGAAAVTIDTHAGVARFASVRVMVESDLRGWLPVMGVELTESEVVRILDQADGVLGGYVDADGQIAFPTRAHVVRGRRTAADR